MLPPSLMLTIKNRTGSDAVRQRERGNSRRVAAFASVFSLMLLLGCTPSGPRALLDGKRLVEKGEYAQAIEKLKAATALLGGTNAAAWNYLGVAYQHAGAGAEADWAYQKALSLNHNLTEVRFNLGCLRLSQNKLEAAKMELTAYTLARPYAPEGFLQLGVAQLRSREPSAAEKSFSESLRLNPQDPEALNGLGLARLMRGRPAEAKQCFEGALKLQKDYAPALLNLAVVEHQYLKDRQAALERYRQLLAVKPPPANAAALAALVGQLAQELKPATSPAAASAPSALMTNSQVSRLPASQPVRTARAAKPEPAPDPRRATATNPPGVESAASAPKSASAAAPRPSRGASQPAGAEPVKASAEPVSDHVSEVSKSPTSSGSLADASAASATAAAPEAAKRGFLQQINPLNLFRGSEKTSLKPTSPESTPGSVTSASGERSPAARGEPATAPVTRATKAAPGRYAYQAPPAPIAGNRPEAERSFADGVQAYQRGRLNDAIQAYRRATRQDPSLYEAHYNLGLVATEAGNLPLALISYEYALAIRPTSLDARYNFALVLKQANYLVDAANELEKVVARYPNEPRAHLALGNLYAQQFAQPVKARPHYLKVLEVEPQHPQGSAIRYWLQANTP